MRSYEASAHIDANPARVWSVLTDSARYPEWNTGIVRVEGRIAPGESITVISKVNPGRAFPVKVTEFVPDQRMEWTGGMPLGLFKGRRTFTLTTEGGATHFEMREEFSGPLLPLIWRSMPDLGPSFRQFAIDLKQRAEAPA